MSNKICHLEGINFELEIIEFNKKKAMKKTKKANNEEFVKEKSFPKREKEKILKIRNCSNGEKNNINKILRLKGLEPSEN